MVRLWRVVWLWRISGGNHRRKEVIIKYLHGPQRGTVVSILVNLSITSETSCWEFWFNAYLQRLKTRLKSHGFSCFSELNIFIYRFVFNLCYFIKYPQIIYMVGFNFYEEDGGKNRFWEWGRKLNQNNTNTRMPIN